MCAIEKHDGTHALFGTNCQKNEAELSNRTTDRSDHYRPSVAPHWLLSPFTKAINKLVASPSRVCPPSPMLSPSSSNGLLSCFHGQTPTTVLLKRNFGLSRTAAFAIWFDLTLITLSLSLYNCVSFLLSLPLLRCSV